MKFNGKISDKFNALATVSEQIEQLVISASRDIEDYEKKYSEYNEEYYKSCADSLKARIYVYNEILEKLSSM